MEELRVARDEKSMPSRPENQGYSEFLGGNDYTIGLAWMIRSGQISLSDPSWDSKWLGHSLPKNAPVKIHEHVRQSTSPSFIEYPSVRKQEHVGRPIDESLFKTLFLLKKNAPFCRSCLQAASQISDILTSWQNLSVEETDSIPPTVLVYLNSTEHFEESAKHCPFCSLIRASVLADLTTRDGYILERSLTFGRLHPFPFSRANSIDLELVPKPSFSRDGSASGLELEYIRVRCGRAKAGYLVTSIDKAVPQLVTALTPGSVSKLPNIFNQLRKGKQTDQKRDSEVSLHTSKIMPLSCSSTPDALNLLRNWTENCWKHHETCRRTISGKDMKLNNPPTLPTRVIDLGTADSDTPRLIETQGTLTGLWVALSHCWGSIEHRPLTTTLNTLKNRLDNIPLDTLPRTFHDAVVVTRMLGIQYLWIDSLCIIQDDKNDWLKEASMMGRVYELAYLTIAATSGKDSRSGLFLPRWYVSLADHHITVPLRKSQQNESAGEASDVPELSFHATIDWRHSGALNDFNPYDDILEPLPQRGWITQEWSLSRRMVHFMGCGMVWSCKTLGIDERGLYDTQVLGRRTHKSSTLLEWKNIIRAHSRRKFTYPGDVLISLEGLAKEMSLSGRGQYTFGMWSDEMPEQLLWYSPEMEEVNTALQNAPSWSWASRWGKVRFHEGDGGKFVNLCKPAVDSMLDQLHVSATLIAVEFTFNDRPSKQLRHNYVSSRLDDENESLCIHSGKVPGNQINIGFAHLDDELPDVKGARSKSNSYFVLLGLLQHEEHPPSLCGLLVQESSSKEGCFERTGTLMIDQDIELWQQRAKRRSIIIV